MLKLVMNTHYTSAVEDEELTAEHKGKVIVSDFAYHLFYHLCNICHFKVPKMFLNTNVDLCLVF